MTTERITIGINTKNRPEALAVQIHSIIHQTYPHWDLTILDCSDAPISESEVAWKVVDLAIRFGHKVQVFRNTEQGIPQTYQKLMEMSPTEFNVREEDDAPWHPQFLEKLYEEMEKNPNLGAVGPRCSNWNFPDSSWPTYPGTNYFFVTGNHAWYQQMGPVLMADDVQRRNWKGTDPVPVSVLHGGFMYRKSLLAKVGGFCTNLSTQGHREETWASLRLYLSGADMLFVPKAIRWHLELQSGGSRDKSVHTNRMTLKMGDERLWSAWIQEVFQSGNPRLDDVLMFSNDDLKTIITPQQALELLNEVKI